MFWIAGQGKEWKQVIQICVLEIQELIFAEYWYYCLGADNIADVYSEHSVNKMWHCGPDWLCNPRRETFCDVEKMPANYLFEMNSIN